MKCVALGIALLFTTLQALSQSRTELVVQQGQNQQKSVVFSHHGKQLLTAGDHTAVLWDIATGFEIREFYGHTASVNSAVFTPSDREIVTGSDDGTVRIWEAATGQEEKQIRADRHVLAAMVSPDGKKIAAAEWDGEVQVWDLATGQQLVRFTAAPSIPAANTSDMLNALAWSPDGKELLTGEKTVAQLWDAQTGREVQRFMGHTYPVRSVAFSPDGRRVVTASNDYTARIWETATGHEIRRFDLGRGNQGVIVTFSPDGGQVLTGLDHGRTLVWDAETGQQILEIPKKVASPPLAVTGTTQEEQIASFLKARQAETFRRTLEWAKNPNSEIVGIAFSPDGRSIAIADEYKLENKSLWLYDSRKGDEIRAFQGNAAEAAPSSLSLAFSKDGLHLWTDGMVDWDLSVGVPDFLRDPGIMHSSIAISHDGSKLALALEESFFLIDMATRHKLLEFTPNEGPKQQVTMFGQKMDQSAFPLEPIHAIQFSPDDRRLVTTGGETDAGEEVRVWDAATGKETARCTLPETKQGMALKNSNAVLFSPDATELVQAGQDHFIYFRDAATCALVAIRELRDVPARQQSGPNDWGAIGDNFNTRLEPLTMSFAPDGSQLLIGTETGILELMNIASWQPVWKFSDTAESPISHTVYSRDGRRIVALAQDRLVVLDAATGREVFRTKNSLPQGNGLAFGPDDKYLVSSHQDGTIRFWSLSNNRLELAATLFTSQDRHWVIADPAGRFDTDLLDDNPLLHWVVSDTPMQPLPLEIFMRQYYTPKLLPELLSGATLPQLPNIADLPRAQPEAKVVAVSASHTQPGRVDLVIRAKRTINDQQQNSGLRDLRVFRDGQLVGYMEGSLQDGDFHIDGVQLSQAHSKATFTAYAFSSALIKSATASQDYEYKASTKPTARAFLLQIGENHYQASGCELQFSANDANQLSDILTERLKTRKFEVDAVTLTSTREHPGATKEDIHRALEEVAARATPDDVFLLSFSGHGYSSPQGEFHLLPSDIQGSCSNADASLLKNAISSDELAAWLRPIDAGQMAFILDSCYSAQSVEANGFKPGPMGSRGLGQLAYDKRIRILAASQSDQTAAEDAELGQGQGVLSYVLTQEGLVNGKADWKPEDGKITVAEWLSYAVNAVPQMEPGKATIPGSPGADGRGFSRAYNGRPKARQIPAVFDFSKDDFVLEDVPRGPGSAGVTTNDAPATPARRAGSTAVGADSPSGSVTAQMQPPVASPTSSALPSSSPSMQLPPPDDHTIVATRRLPSARRIATITAPGNGWMSYNLFMIDTRDFTAGGVLDIDIQIDSNSGTDGSFDLFPADVPIPTRGRPIGTLTGRYDIRRGASTRIEYRFAKGQIFALGLEGNWFSPKGATGMVRFSTTVRN